MYVAKDTARSDATHYHSHTRDVVILCKQQDSERLKMALDGIDRYGYSFSEVPMVRRGGSVDTVDERTMDPLYGYSNVMLMTFPKKQMCHATSRRIDHQSENYRMFIDSGLVFDGRTLMRLLSEWRKQQ